MRRIIAVARKEFLHVLRDPRSLGVGIAMPAMMLLLYGYAIDMEMKHLRLAVLDFDHSAESRRFVDHMGGGEFIVVSEHLHSHDESEPAFRQNRFHAALVIPSGFAESLVSQNVTPVQLVVDGADGTTAAIVESYLNAMVAMENRRLTIQTLGIGTPPIEARSRVLYNPELVSAHFVVPGLVAVVLVMICALLTSIAITREKETGTLEQILTTPVKAGQVIAGKAAPYLVIAALDACLVLGLGRAVFGVPMAGSWLVLAAYSLIYLGIALSLGLLISAISDSQQVAMSLALMITMLPTLMVSGFIFPISSMPVALQMISHLIPATYYLQVIRGIMLKGDAWFPFQGAVMIGMCAVLLILSVKKFKSRLE